MGYPGLKPRKGALGVPGDQPGPEIGPFRQRHSNLRPVQGYGSRCPPQHRQPEGLSPKVGFSGLDLSPGGLPFRHLGLDPGPVPGEGLGEALFGGSPGQGDHHLAFGGDHDPDAPAPGAVAVFDVQSLEVIHKMCN